MTASKCSSCGAAILWAKTPQGKNIPLDMSPEKRVILGRTSGLAHVLDAYMPHWATCPSADQHRADKSADVVAAEERLRAEQKARRLIDESRRDWQDESLRLRAKVAQLEEQRTKALELAGSIQASLGSDSSLIFEELKEALS